MKDSSRPRRLDEIAGDGMKLGGRLALGLLAAPLLGLALLATRTGRSSGPSVAETDSPVEPTSPPASAEGATEITEVPASIPGGPARAEIEDALRKLAEATIPNGARSSKDARRKRAAAGGSLAEAQSGQKSRRVRPKDAADCVPVPPS